MREIALATRDLRFMVFIDEFVSIGLRVIIKIFMNELLPLSI
jgi:hypothetical protein